jgi:hypothetical protein
MHCVAATWSSRVQAKAHNPTNRRVLLLLLSQLDLSTQGQTIQRSREPGWRSLRQKAGKSDRIVPPSRWLSLPSFALCVFTRH